MKHSLSKYYVLWILAVCLLAFAALEIAEAKKPTKPPQEEDLQLDDKNIVTATPIGEIMRVWGYKGIDSEGKDYYENIWTKEGERYKAVALGDIDGRQKRVPRGCESAEGGPVVNNVKETGPTHPE